LQLSTGATGGANATMMLTQTSAASGNYYADIGLYNSKGLIGNLSALGAGYPSGNLFVANDVVFLGGQQNAGTNLIFLTNTSGALKFGTGGFAVSNERMRIGAAGGVSVGNSYVTTDPGAGNLIVSGKVGVGTSAPGAVLEVNGTAKFDGLVTFASGQTFPGTGKGTITGVTASSPLTGGGTSGAVTVGLSTSALETTLNGVYAQLGAVNAFVDAATFADTVTVTATEAYGNSVAANATGNGSYAVYAHASGMLDRGHTPLQAPAGVYALGDSGSGVLGFAGGQSDTYNGYGGLTAGVWGDTSGYSTAGIFGTADDLPAGFFVNNSDIYPAVAAENGGAGGRGLFRAFKAVTPDGTCGISDGILRCTGQVETLATSRDGARTVETYAMQSPENWMEDFGVGAVAGGVGVVQIDPGFADMVSADSAYHVFLTPHGDSKGLYVINMTANSFEVRESGGGTSSLSFDYRIVGKRRGYEAQRMVDVTDRFKAEQAATKRMMPTGVKARASQGVVEPQTTPQKPASQSKPSRNPS
jgi:hypothetical protein